MVNLVKKKKVKTKKALKTKKAGKLKSKESKNQEEIIYQKSNVLKILTDIKPGLAVKDIVEGMKNFYFDEKFVITYNDKISILYPFKTNFEAFINANTLYKLLANLPTEDFKMKHTGGNLIIKAKGVNVKLPAITDSEIVNRIKLVNKGVKKVKWQKLPDNFSESINLCSFAASQTDAETTLSCVKLDKDICVASDSKRIAYSKLTSEISPMYIKAGEVKHLININPTHYGLSKGWLYFKNEKNCIFSIRKIEGSFPDWEHLFDFKGSKITLPKELLNGVDLASVFTEGGNKPYITINIEKNRCNLLVKTESGKLTYNAPIEYDSKPIDFIINPDFLKEMMRFSTTITFAVGRAKLETETFSVLTALYSNENDED